MLYEVITFPNIFGYLFKMLNTAFNSNGIHQFRAIKTPFFCYIFKVWIHLQQFIVIHNISNKTQGKQGLNTAGTVRNDA